MNLGILNEGDEVTVQGIKESCIITSLSGDGAMVKHPTGTELYIPYERITTYDRSEESESNAFSTQVGGGHYAKLKIQPMQYCLENNLNYAQSNAIKYITRYKDKNGKQDLEKAIHCLQLLIDYEYGDK